MLDIFSQYGVGQGFIFSFLLGESPAGTLINFQLLFTAVSIIFFVLAYHFLTFLFESRWVAFAVCLVGILGQFYSSLDIVWYSITPSVGIYRMPLLFITAGLLIVMLRAKHSAFSMVALGATLAVSVYWQTDTGLATAAAVLAVVLAWETSWRGALLALGVTACSLFLFLALLALSYGPRAVSIEFLQAIIAPFGWYTGGELTFDVDFPWTGDSGYVVALLCQVIALSVVVAIPLQRFLDGDSASFKIGLLFLAIISLILQCKYVVRSVAPYWFGTALPAQAVVVWAIIRFTPVLAPFNSLRPKTAARLGWGVQAGLLATLFAWMAGGDRISSYVRFNSLLNVALAYCHAPGYSWPFVSGLREFDAVSPANFCSDSDRKLIRKHSQEGERIALVSIYDWAYLIETRRAPRFYFLPSHTLVDRRKFAALCDQQANVFVDRRLDAELPLFWA